MPRHPTRASPTIKNEPRIRSGSPLRVLQQLQRLIDDFLGRFEPLLVHERLELVHEFADRGCVAALVLEFLHAGFQFFHLLLETGWRRLAWTMLGCGAR